MAAKHPPPPTLHSPHICPHTHTQSVGNGFSQAGNPMLNVLPVDDAHAKGKRAPSPVSWALFVQAASNDMSNTQLLRFGQPLPLPLLLLPSLCCLSVWGILIIVVDREAFRGFATAYGANDLVPWPQASKVMTSKMSKMIRNIYAILFFWFFFLFAIFLSSV